MEKLQQIKQLIEDFENDLGIWGDIIGGLCLVVIFVGLFVMVG